jgi:hypothetical protein
MSTLDLLRTSVMCHIRGKYTLLTVRLISTIYLILKRPNGYALTLFKHRTQVYMHNAPPLPDTAESESESESSLSSVSIPGPVLWSLVSRPFSGKVAQSSQIKPPCCQQPAPHPFFAAQQHFLLHNERGSQENKEVYGCVRSLQCEAQRKRIEHREERRQR